MQGVVYKEFRQNRVFFIQGLLLPPAGIIMTLLMYAAIKDNISAGESDTFMMILRLIIQTVSFMMLWMGSSVIFSGDENKKWSAFIAAAPNGRVRHIYGKYVFYFMTLGAFFMSSMFCDSFFSWLIYCGTGKTDMLSFTNLYLLMIFLLMMMFAFETPFVARFGTKLGTGIRIAVLSALFLAFAIWMLFVPSADNVADYLSEYLMKFTEGELSGGVTFIISVFPIAAMGAYLLSYKISESCWLKGVENYDK